MSSQKIHDNFKKHFAQNYDQIIQYQREARIKITESNSQKLQTNIIEGVDGQNQMKDSYGNNESDVQVNENNTEVVVICTGSYCPAHEGHVQMMKDAFSCLKDKMVVLFGIFSPACDGYVKNKLKDFHMNLNQRQQHLQELIKDIDPTTNIRVDTFEGNLGFFLDYPEVCTLWRNELNKRKIKLAYCVGSDLLKYSIDNYFQKFCDYLIIVERDQRKIDVPKDNLKKNIFIIRGSEYEGVSSTQIRQQMMKGKGPQQNPTYNKTSLF